MSKHSKNKGCLIGLLGLLSSFLIFIVTYFVMFMMVIVGVIYTLEFIRYISPDFYIWAITSYKDLLMLN